MLEVLEARSAFNASNVGNIGAEGLTTLSSKAGKSCRECNYTAKKEGQKTAFSLLLELSYFCCFIECSLDTEKIHYMLLFFFIK